MRRLLLVILNLSLPFILFALRNWYWRYKHPDKDLPKLDTKRTLRLLAWGVLLLFITLFATRALTPADIPFHGNDATTQDY